MGVVDGLVEAKKEFIKTNQHLDTLIQMHSDVDEADKVAKL